MNKDREIIMSMTPRVLKNSTSSKCKNDDDDDDGKLKKKSRRKFFFTFLILQKKSYFLKQNCGNFCSLLLFLNIKSEIFQGLVLECCTLISLITKESNISL